MIEEYNKYMGGVDRADQLLTYYGYPHFSKKWWKRVCFHLLDTTYILYSQCTPKNDRLSHMDFQIEVARSLLSQSSQGLSVTPSASHTSLRVTGRHFPIPGMKRDCKRRKSGKRQESSYKCDVCDVNLCVTPCFKKYHTLKKYN